MVSHETADGVLRTWGLSEAAGPARRRRPQRPYGARLRARRVHHGVRRAGVRADRRPQRRTGAAGRRPGRTGTRRCGTRAARPARARGRGPAGDVLPAVGGEAARYGPGRAGGAAAARASGPCSSSPGDGPLRARLEQRARERGCPSPSSGMSPTAALLGALQASADVCLAPGPAETFGLAALEAMACGTPVVASASSALPEVDRGRRGHRRRRRGAASRTPWRGCWTAPRAAQAARARAECFGWDTAVDAFLAAHDAALPPGRRPAPRRSGAAPVARSAAAPAAAFVASSCADAVVRRAWHEPLPFVALGDSLTEGVGDPSDGGGAAGPRCSPAGCGPAWSSPTSRSAGPRRATCSNGSSRRRWRCSPTSSPSSSASTTPCAAPSTSTLWPHGSTGVRGLHRRAAPCCSPPACPTPGRCSGCPARCASRWPGGSGRSTPSSTPSPSATGRPSARRGGRLARRPRDVERGPAAPGRAGAPAARRPLPRAARRGGSPTGPAPRGAGAPGAHPAPRACWWLATAGPAGWPGAAPTCCRSCSRLAAAEMRHRAAGHQRPLDLSAPARPRRWPPCPRGRRPRQQRPGGPARTGRGRRPDRVRGPDGWHRRGGRAPAVHSGPVGRAGYARTVWRAAPAAARGECLTRPACTATKRTGVPGAAWAAAGRSAARTTAITG